MRLAFGEGHGQFRTVSLRQIADAEDAGRQTKKAIRHD
jgi:hypothetical protein